jgi:hypothetical protein
MEFLNSTQDHFHLESFRTLLVYYKEVKDPMDYEKLVAILVAMEDLSLVELQVVPRVVLLEESQVEVM